MSMKKKFSHRGSKKSEPLSVTERPTGPTVRPIDLKLGMQTSFGLSQCLLKKNFKIFAFCNFWNFWWTPPLPLEKKSKSQKIKCRSYDLFSVRNKLYGCLGPPDWIFRHSLGQKPLVRLKMAWKFQKSSFAHMAYFRSEISYMGVWGQRTGYFATYD